MIERKVYQCEHCKRFRRTPKVFFKRSDAYFHEKRCFYNLDRKTCFSCKHNIKPLSCGIEKNQENESRLTISDAIKTNCEYWEQKDYHNREGD